MQQEQFVTCLFYIEVCCSLFYIATGNKGENVENYPLYLSLVYEDRFQCFFNKLLTKNVLTTLYLIVIFNAYLLSQMALKGQTLFRNITNFGPL